MRPPLLALCLTLVLPASSFAQTPLSNTPVTEAQIAKLVTSNKPVLYSCKDGVYDDIGNTDGQWGQGPSPGHITSAAWDMGNNRYLYAYQLSNCLQPEGCPDLGGWDVAGQDYGGFRIPLGHKHIVPLDFDGDHVLDTSFRTTEFVCTPGAQYGCSPFNGPFAVFTSGGSDACGWSVTSAEPADQLEGPYVDETQPDVTIHFIMHREPGCCLNGIFWSSPVFGFVTDAPPAYVDGVNLGGASASIRIVAPVPRVLLVHGICGNAGSWDTFAQILSDSGFVVDRLQYGSQDFSDPPDAYVGALAAKISQMNCDKVAIVAHSMGG